MLKSTPDPIVFFGVCSRTLRQFNQNQKTVKSIANLKLNTMGSFIPQKNSVFWIQIELRSMGGCNCHISHFITFLMIVTPQNLRNKIEMCVTCSQ